MTTFAHTDFRMVDGRLVANEGTRLKPAKYLVHEVGTWGHWNRCTRGRECEAPVHLTIWITNPFKFVNGAPMGWGDKPPPNVPVPVFVGSDYEEPQTGCGIGLICGSGGGAC